MTVPLFLPLGRPLTVLYADLETFALSQNEVFAGTAGSVVVRTNQSGFRYYAHSYYGGDGKKQERYLAGPIGEGSADAKAEAMGDRIRELKDLVPSLRLLGREGFSVADARTYATLASMHNNGVFQAGGMLIGSHAYGVLLNRLGVRAAPYSTDDIDIARRAALAFKRRQEKGFLQMLLESGIEFVEVPALDRTGPSTSFKQRGRSSFRVDLLVPSPNETFSSFFVPELKAHATGLPYLEYLLAESQMAALLAREGCCMVRVPLPERYAIHKLIVAPLRGSVSAKSDKDVLQASVLCATLAELHPGAIQTAIRAVPRRAKKHLSRGIQAARRYLDDAHPRAWEELHS